MSFYQVLSCREDLQLTGATGNNNFGSVWMPVSRATIKDRGRRVETLIKAISGKDLVICRVFFNAGADSNRAMMNKDNPATFQRPARAGTV